MATTLSPFLSSPATLSQFLSGNREASEITHPGSAPYTSANGEKAPGGWDELYYWATGLFLTMRSYFYHVVGMTDLSKRTWVDSRHAFANATQIKTREVFQKNLLARSINTHRVGSEDFYLRPPEKTTMKTHPVPESLQFFYDKGVCRGMCHWFAHLYFKTRGRFSNPDEHFKSVGRQFERGAPNQAALLQGLELAPVYAHLGFDARLDYSKLSIAGKTHDQCIGLLQLRPPGVYGIYVSNHQVLYIKVDETHQYLFDPNTGAIKVDSPAMLKMAMEPYLTAHDTKNEIYFDLYTPR